MLWHAMRGGFLLGGFEEKGTDSLAAKRLENIKRDDVRDFGGRSREDEAGNFVANYRAANLRDMQCALGTKIMSSTRCARRRSPSESRLDRLR
jgi:hypothetical protein